jgi:hypothetical protein
MRAETTETRIIGEHVFKHVPTGNSPPRELTAEVEAENAKIDREALTTPFENPISVAQRDIDEARKFEENVEPYIKTIWIERNTPPNTEKLKFEMQYFFRGIRPNVLGEATTRSEFLIRCAAIPFHEYLPEPPRVSTHAGRKRVWEVPVNTKPVRESFPLAFFTLSEFLKTHKPEPDRDIEILEILSAPDVGHENEKRPEPEHVPTMPELMQLMANALKPKPA